MHSVSFLIIAQKCSKCATGYGLIIDGIFNGVGSVLSFLPIIIVLFFFLSLLEDTGYMARITLFLDKLFRKLGLSGKSLIPFIVGSGCSVPGIMSSRTIENEKNKQIFISFLGIDNDNLLLYLLVPSLKIMLG